MDHNQTSRRGNLLMRVIRFYRDGFRSMTVGRYLWAMIIIKLFILFFIFLYFFFMNRTKPQLSFKIHNINYANERKLNFQEIASKKYKIQGKKLNILQK